jgi:glutaminase
MNYQTVLDSIYKQVMTFENTGAIARYIPELAKVNPNKFGVHITTLNDDNFGVGDSEEKFSIQSIAKVLSLSLAYTIKGVELWKRVDVEPSGTPFNSLVQLEYHHGIPRNPMINAGAIVICDVLLSSLEDPKKGLIEFIRKVSQIPSIDYNDKIAQSEKSVGYQNRALVNLMKALGNIENEAEEVLALYFSLCSIEMTCRELSRTFLFLANDGIEPISKKTILSHSRSKRVNAIIQTCGFYDEAGEFSFRVGLPGKSGVGGGIMAIHPENFCIAVWSPKLNKKGNSHRGMKFLELFTTETGSSIF